MGTSLNYAKQSFGDSSIELIPGNQVSTELIDGIYEVEQDVWARFLGEYLSCNDCGHKMSKDDVYGAGNLPQIGIDIKKHTVRELERITGNKAITCDCCRGNTSHVFGPEFKEEIASRNDFDEAYLLVQKSTSEKVLGFASSYVSDFDTIYDREFDYYYSKIGKEDIRDAVESTLEAPLPSELFCFAAIGNAPGADSIPNLHLLFQSMFQKVEQNSPGLTGLYETVLRSMTHNILETMNTKRIYTDPEKSQNSNPTINSDIFVHKNMAGQGLKTLGTSCKSYIRKYGKRLREIRE